MVMVEMEEVLGKLTDRMQIKRDHGVSLLQSLLDNAGKCFGFPLFLFCWSSYLVVWLGKEKDWEWFVSTERETLDKSVKSGFADMVKDFGGFAAAFCAISIHESLAYVKSYLFWSLLT
jgi:hypothetical protein